MAKTKNRIKKMTFQRQTRTITTPISDDDKYLLNITEGAKHENIQRTTRRGLRSQYI